MAEDLDEGEKTEEPTQHRIDEFRKRGEVAYSRELNSVLILSASLLALSLSLIYIFEQMSDFILWLYNTDVRIAFTDKIIKTIATKAVVCGLKCAGPVVLTAMISGLLAQISQIGFLYSPEVLELNFDRINPVNGIKKLFSLQALFESVKGIIKFAAALAVAYWYLKSDIEKYNSFMHLEIFQSFVFAKSILIKLSFAIILALGVVALIDFGYQKFTYRKKLMQTKQQLKQETKEQDGNPEVKNRIRMIQREMSKKRMLSEVKKADVIITNPTHLSIVLKYDSSTMVSPMVIGKGADHLAMKIREIAKEHNIPMVENVPLARALYKNVKVNRPVPRELYKAVAEVLAFVYRLKKKEKALR